VATTNYERVGKALELLRDGLVPFVERELAAVYRDNWRAKAALVLRGDHPAAVESEGPHLDAHALLTLMWFQWNEVFARSLGHAERSLVSELREARNRWAHQKAFSSDDAYRALDSVERLLSAVSAPQAAEVGRAKMELLRVRFDEQARQVTRRAPVEGQPTGGLRPWREVITPHPDVAAGRYQQAEFAADLGQVQRGEGADEYRDPREFFRRTYLTEGLRHLLTEAVRRLSGAGGDPVVELQTNFGGGKTHSMLALYHLFAGTPVRDLPGVESLVREADLPQPPPARRAVLVGTALSPGQPRRKEDGTVTRTLWGELAWQLSGARGYAFVREADEAGVSPGSDALRALFESQDGPCLVLIDEWVTFVRQLYKVDGLPAGSFDANLTFAQSLTEAARQCDNVLVVASIPASDIEKGGEGGEAAVERLRNIFGRMESAWRPASAEEGFEIVRRRLFAPIVEPAHFAARDAVVRAFADLYRGQPQEFPPECREGDYARRLEAAYPIHPELFDRLYNDWSTLDRFQRTRGVLRLMAAVIHDLWERQDGGLMIMPASVPIDAQPVQFELTRYMDDPWVPVIEKDVDGPRSLPLDLDRNNPNLGKYSACRRVARTLYMGSAPTVNTSRRGLEDRSVRLGCVQPGESVAVFGDALRRLTDNATHLYVDGHRYWFSTQPSVARVAQDRAARYDAEAVRAEIVRRLRLERDRGDFVGVHVAPGASGDVPDEMTARLVVLGPEHAHTGRVADSPARREAERMLASRGSAPRQYRNMLVFLAPDAKRMEELEASTRTYLAWKAIARERNELNLDAFQEKQAITKGEQADATVTGQIPEAYSWLLAPAQPDPHGPVEWVEQRVSGQGTLAARASRKLVKEMSLLHTIYGAALLRMDLDATLWGAGDHVSVKTLWGYYATYTYLARLVDAEVLVGAVRSGIASLLWERETFAYAERYDAATGRYVGLAAGHLASVSLNDHAVLVKPAAARRQLDEDARRQLDEDERRRRDEDERRRRMMDGGSSESPDNSTNTDGRGGHVINDPPAPPLPAILRRFHGVAELDAMRIGRDAGRIAEEIVQHLSTLPGARVQVRLEIEAEIPEGAPEGVVRTVSENGRTLKLISQGFEEE